MRCSICQHIFSYTIESEVSLEKEFDMLLSSDPVRDSSTQAQAPPSESGVFDESFTEITETLLMKFPRRRLPLRNQRQHPNRSSGKSIPSSAPEAKRQKEEEIIPEEPRKRSALKIAVLVICLIVAALASLWLLRDKIPFLRQAKHELAQTPIQKGPFFAIEEQNLVYEMLTHEQEGSVLVIKGNLKKISERSVESVMVEARVYDNGGNLIESRLAYAGIIPDTSEFTRQPPRDIDALLTSDPASPGSTLPSSDIPFAVAFFGKPAQMGSSFQVEVKDIRWK
jgi:hypothetical protein